MNIQSQMETICAANDYDFSNSITDLMEKYQTECKEQSISTKERRNGEGAIRQRLRQIISDKTPYSLYVPEEQYIEYDEMQNIVSWMTDERDLNYVDRMIDFFDYRAMAVAVRPYFRRVRSAMANGFTGFRIKAEVMDYTVNLKANHLVLFDNMNECACDICGAKVRFASIDNQRVKGKEFSYKISLWTVDDTNRLIRMTVDHKQARGLGGGNYIPNMVPMCELCNSRKSTIESRLATHNQNVEKVKNAELYPFECRFYC